MGQIFKSYRTSIYIVSIALLIGTLTILFIVIPTYYALAKDTKNIFDASRVSLEINDISPNNPVSVIIKRNYESITLAPGTTYRVTYSASSNNCLYHYSGEKDLQVYGTNNRDMVVPQKGQLVIHTLTCTSQNKSWFTQKILIVRITSPIIKTPPTLVTTK